MMQQGRKQNAGSRVRLPVPAISIRTDTNNQVKEQIHHVAALKGSVIESLMKSSPTQSDLPCSDELQTALGYFRSRTVLFTLGLHLPFLCARLSFFHSLFQNHHISQTLHGSPFPDGVISHRKGKRF